MDAQEAMRQVQYAAQSAHMVFTEREAMQLVTTQLQSLRAAPSEEQLAFLYQALTALPDCDSYALKLILRGMSGALLRGGIELNTIEAIRLVDMCQKPRVEFPHKALLSAVEQAPRTQALTDALLALRASIDEWHGGPQMRELHNRIDALVQGRARGFAADSPIEAAGAWSRRVFQDAARGPNHFAWRALFQHARSLTQSTASNKWIAEAVRIAGQIPREEFVQTSHRWLAIGPMPDMPQVQMPEDEAAIQKGFIWTIGAVGDASLSPDLADYAFACFRKIPMLGAVSHRVGNACLNALSVMPGLDAVAQLSRLAARVRYDVARRLIEKALCEAAARNHVSREDLEAMSVPAFGLDANGVRRETVGDCVAELAVKSGEARLTWTSNSQPLKSIPAALKSAHAAEINGLKRTAKELDALLSAMRIRMERMLLSPGVTAYPRWREWYLDHPVAQAFTRRLIWEFGEGRHSHTAIWHDGALVDWAGNPVASSDGAMVRLWHPVRASVQTVLSWRCWIEDHAEVQPFQQAHREVYLLTEAERQTATYSLRFAGHILRQHQFAALCKERGWQFTLMGKWDSHNTPQLTLPDYQLKAELEVEFPRNEDDVSGHGVYLTAGTGKICFRRAGEREDPNAVFFGGRPATVRLEDVPPVVFSEVMRDVDLFASVASIGADALWGQDRPADPHIDYWREFGFAELSESAQNRKSILESLLPKLALRDHCHIEGRHLIVRGRLHTYRIHLGSANVILEPGSRYICIVQGAGDSAERLWLPFEGDRILALILSKALLLVNDSHIKDEAIRRQL
ncbi:MAG: DUF4132 domain-containing protein [Acidobacteria bacterium]|nr:DUF4132 domain-containing protein [Acidobacteriota bacterium]